ncbi:MAG: hypothetical protein IJQ06_07065 [Paludibacteraceae bacterium]|nr:hypothetical protein [Paludibacteraceae bacterium]
MESEKMKKPENPDRPDRYAHPEPCGEESGQLYCPETTKKEKYKEIYANFRGMESGKVKKTENPDRPDRYAHPDQTSTKPSLSREEERGMEWGRLKGGREG